MSIFVDIDPGTIVPQLVQDFEDYLGVVLGAGDQRREFLQGFGYALTTALQTKRSSWRPLSVSTWISWGRWWA